MAKQETNVPQWAKAVPEEAQKTEEVKLETRPPESKKSFLAEQGRGVSEEPLKKKRWWQKDLSFGSTFFGVPLQEQILFARHLSLMAKAGVSILDSLQLLKKQARSGAMIKILDGAARGVSNGQFLSVALTPYKNAFGDLFINIVKIGETSGTLPENLTYLAEELSKKSQLKSKIKGAMVYPVIIVIGVIAIVSFLVFFLFPKIIPVFKTLNIQLPLPTRILIAVASFAQEYTIAIALAILVLIIILWLLLKVRSIQKVFHRLLLAIPVVGSLSRAVNISSFCRTLSILLRSGSRIVESLGTAGNTLGNLVYRDKIIEAGDVVRKGGQLSEHLEKFPRLFSPMLSQMIFVGEKTGNLSETLQYLGGFYEEEIDNTTKNLSTTIEPVLLIILGGIVGFVAIAVITPIYGITQGV